MTLNQFKTELNKSLKRFFKDDEIKEIISYYEEMIDERLDDGELIDAILKDYDPKEIAKSMIPKVIKERGVKQRKSPKHMWLIVLFLFSSPILIPIGVTYLSLVIVAFALVITGLAVILGGLAGAVIGVVRVIALSLPQAEALSAVGIQMVAFSMMLLLGYLIMKFSWLILEQLALWFSRLIVRKKVSHEDF